MIIASVMEASEVILAPLPQTAPPVSGQSRIIEMGDPQHAKTLSGHSKSQSASKLPSKTVITSQSLEMVSGLVENTFYFSKDVHVVGTNLNMTSDQMVVTAARAEGDPNDISKALPATQNQMGTIHKIVAIGNVHIIQVGRESISNRAEFFPKENKVVLTEKPRVIDSQAIVSGWRITLYQGERKVMVEQDPSVVGGGRPTVDLGALPDMGFDPSTAPTPVPAVPSATPSPAASAPAVPTKLISTPTK